MGLVKVITIPVLSLIPLSATATETQVVHVYNSTLLTPGAILLSALIGAIVAIIVVAKHRIVNQKQSAITFLTLLNTDGDYKKDEQVFVKLSRSKKLNNILSVKDTDIEGWSDRVSISTYLNMFELLCVSINRHVFDENVCKAAIGDHLVKRWEDAKELILEIRITEKEKHGEDSNHLYEQFQTRAEHWRENPKIIDIHPIKRIWQEIYTL